MKNKSLLKYIVGAVILVVVIVIIVLSMGKKSNEAKNEPANLVGNWVSTVAGKGMQGSGKITIFNTSAQVDVSGDINLTIEKVENNVASGTVTYNNLCYTSTRTTAGKAVAQAPKCVSGISKTIQAQIVGDKLTIQNQTILGVDLAYEASFTNKTITGTFSRIGANENINENFSGTFDLVRAPK